MQKTKWLFVVLMVLTSLAEAKPAKSSTHMFSVERIFTARPRSLSYRYLITVLCQPEGESIVTVPAKNVEFKWKVGAQSGVSITDNQGKTEFTQTAYDGKLVETLEIDYEKQKMLFSSAKGLQQVVVRKDCGK